MVINQRGSSSWLRRVGIAGVWLALAGVVVCQESPLRRAAELDRAGKCDEAEALYRQLAASQPASVVVLNNLGNHYLVCGRAEQAESSFECVLKINPKHENANLQLARIATERKQGKKALEYLANVQASSPAIRLLRAEALHNAGQDTDSSRVLDEVEREAGGDARTLFALGLACARIGFHERAERAFNTVLASRPDDFDVLFNLGRAAARAHHFDRAQRALKVAVKLRPTDPDALLELGLAYAAVADYNRSVYILAQARQLAPRRPDLLLALARAAEDAGFYGDAARTYDEYLAVRPKDDAARRDRGLVSGRTATRAAEGLKELAWYVAKHPNDATGYYDLAQLTWKTDPQSALEQLSAAVRLDPRFAPARHARAWLLERLGRTAESIPDLEAAIQVQPDNVRALDQLGLAHLSLDQPAKAEKVLRRALAAAPRDPQVLLHLGRALIAQDRQPEAQQYLDLFQQVKPQQVRDPRRDPGMIELATMSPADRARSQIERLRVDVRQHPGDAELQLELAGLLLGEGRTEEAWAAYRELLSANAAPAVWQRAGTTLLRAGQYQLAKVFLERATADIPAAWLDLAIARLFTAGPAEALNAIDQVPEAERQGDYWLMKARILEAAGRNVEAEDILSRELSGSASRPEVIVEAARLLFRHNRVGQAVTMLSQAVKSNPGNSDLLLEQAAIGALAGDGPGADRLLRQIEIRWPEWSRAWLVHGLVLEKLGQPRAALQKLQTAAALGGNDTLTSCALAQLSGKSAGPECACAERLAHWVLPSCR